MIVRFTRKGTTPPCTSTPRDLIMLIRSTLMNYCPTVCNYVRIASRINPALVGDTS